MQTLLKHGVTPILEDEHGNKTPLWYALWKYKHTDTAITISVIVSFITHKYRNHNKEIHYQLIKAILNLPLNQKIKTNLFTQVETLHDLTLSEDSYKKLCKEYRHPSNNEVLRKIKVGISKNMSKNNSQEKLPLGKFFLESRTNKDGGTETVAVCATIATPDGPILNPKAIGKKLLTDKEIDATQKLNSSEIKRSTP